MAGQGSDYRMYREQEGFVQHSPIIKKAALAVTIALISACGGGNGGGVGSTPPPPPPPAPTPTPAPTPPPIPSGPLGLQSTEPFKTYSVRINGWSNIWSEEDAIEISYSASDGKYHVSGGTYVPLGGNGSYNANGWINLDSTYGYVSVNGSTQHESRQLILDWPGSSPYSYTGFGSEFESAPFGEHKRVFSYGIPTAANDVPITGVANYVGEIRGLTDGTPATPGGGTGPALNVFGSVALAFDFGAGTLSGEMKPEIAPEWDAVSLGTYTFRDTVYATGSPAFSGAFAVPGSSDASSFSGIFTGPQGTELMAKWQAPFLYPGTDSWGTMAGVWIAKKN